MVVKVMSGWKSKGTRMTVSEYGKFIYFTWLVDEYHGGVGYSWPASSVMCWRTGDGDLMCCGLNITKSMNTRKWVYGDD